MRKINYFILGAIGWLLWQPNAYASWVNAKVIKIDNDNDSLLVQRLDDRGTEVSDPIEVVVSHDTKFETGSSVKDLQEGAQIKINLQQDDKAGTWKADAVDLNHLIIGQ